MRLPWTSTREQKEDRQLIALKDIGVPEKNIYLDKLSGENFDRPQYKKLVRKLDENSVLYITSIDRLGRNYRDLSEQWRIITKEKGMVTGFNAHNSECTESDFFNMWSYRATNADPRTIYVIRDSFSSHMAGYIGSQFNHTYLRHLGSYTYEDLENCNPDIVVYECVERGVDWLGSFSIK